MGCARIPLCFFEQGNSITVYDDFFFLLFVLSTVRRIKDKNVLILFAAIYKILTQREYTNLNEQNFLSSIRC